DPSHSSYDSQISSVFKVPGKKDLYIACADRWMPGAMDVPYEYYARAFEGAFSEDATPEERAAAIDILNSTPPARTREADYVWLPFRFDGEMGYLDWRDEWTLDEFE
ncbi:MAG: hypothetical protein J6V14_00530, partial [Clostridia bacterium]|nr:hypothetical protein [Clostridia bacterium]